MLHRCGVVWIGGDVGKRVIRGKGYFAEVDHWMMLVMLARCGVKKSFVFQFPNSTALGKWVDDQLLFETRRDGRMRFGNI